MSLKPQSFNRNYFLLILSAVVAILLTAFLRTGNFSFQRPILEGTLPTPTVTPKTEESLKVKEVVDGDTIVLENGEEVRYLGIDTPELHHPEVGEECGGKEAKEANSKLVLGKKVKLEKDITDKDHYGRLLRFVFAEDGEFVNYELIRRGHAQVLAIPPDKKFEKVFIDAQLTAKKENLGIWQNCFKRR